MDKKITFTVEPYQWSIDERYVITGHNPVTNQAITFWSMTEEELMGLARDILNLFVK